METLVLRVGLGARLGRLWEIVELVAELRGVREPLTTETGLRQTVAVLLRLAELMGLDAELVERLRRIAGDEQVLGIVLAVLRYVLPRERVAAAGESIELQVEAAGLIEWLPWAWEIARWVWLLRGELRHER